MPALVPLHRSLVARLFFAASLLFLLIPLARAAGQQPSQASASAWQGEWGSFTRISASGYPQFNGRGLTIDGCDAPGRCKVRLRTSDKQSHAEADGTLEIQSPTSAIAHLSAFGKEHCSLRLTLDATPAITAAANTGDCSYFATSGATFLATYPLHTRQIFQAEDVAACFASTEPAEAALCASAELSAQQKQWFGLYLEVADLLPDALASGGSSITGEQNAQSSILAGCNHSADAGRCLRDAFAQSTADLNHRKAVWIESVTTPGDPARAAKDAAAIAGNYRHTFANGDVQGEQFRSTDTLQITRLASDAIRYDIHLEFYNGHECNLQGTATYRSAGFFVDQKPAGSPQFPACYFEIKAAIDGIHFADPTGGCKMLSCGMRGGYNATQFLFREEVQDLPPRPKT